MESVTVSTPPRVRLADIEAAIAARYDFTADQVVGPPAHDALKALSICIVVMKNGYSVIGQSIDAEAGKKLAYESVVRQLYPLMGFAARDKQSSS